MLMSLAVNTQKNAFPKIGSASEHLANTDKLSAIKQGGQSNFLIFQAIFRVKHPASLIDICMTGMGVAEPRDQ